MKTVILLVVLSVGLGACGASRKLSEGAARNKIRELGLADFKDKEIQIQKIIQSGEDNAVVEASLQMAFRLAKSEPEGWQVQAIRMGDRDWIDVQAFLAALNEVRARETRRNLERLQKGIQKYRASVGTPPQASNIVQLTDLLYPLYMPELVRYDGWNREFRVELKAGEIQIVSAGPDGIPGNADDISLNGNAA